MGTLTGKNRNASSRFFPSEYMRTADIMDPINAKSMAPIVKIITSPGISAVFRLRNSKDEKIRESSTITKVIIP